MEQVDASNEQHGIIISDILWTIVTQISKKKTKQNFMPSMQITFI